MSDYIIRATAANDRIRVFAATTKDLVETARKIHNLSPVSTAALGRCATAALMMGITMKGEKDALTIQYVCDGPIGGITVTAGSKGNVKGYVKNPAVILPPNKDGHFDVGGAVGKGFLHVMKDIGLKEPYSGEVEIRTGEIAEDLAYYYAVSEQVPSAVALGVLMNKNNTVREAGGYMIQLMPDCPEEVIAELERKIAATPNVTDLLRNGETPERILKDILGTEDLKILDKVPAEFKCDCSPERVTKVLIAMGKKELTELIRDKKPVTLNCQFCSKSYTFSTEELQKICGECTR